MFLQQAPAETTNYMILGFTVILGTIGLYVVSIAVRMRNARRDLEVLGTLQGKPGG